MRTHSLLSAALLISSVAFAQQAPPPDGPLQGPGGAPNGGPANGADVPSRAARLSFLNGQVSFQPASVEDWVPATLNRPLTTGDRLFTDNGARAEMNIGSAAMRLNGRSNFAFINLDDRTAQVQLSLGTLNIRVRRLADDETMEIDTPQAALSILRPGEYRVDVNEQGDTTIVTVRGGEMEATAAQAFAIHPREQIRISNPPGEGGQPVLDRRDMPPADPFDNFCQDRDRREDMSQSSRYVSREMPGYSDLDTYGGWRQEPQYGAVWYPRGVDVGWAPYHTGHWAWIAPWGWTWVDDAPWGYAPFHYGRWAYIGGAWGWIPGPVVVGVRPVYAPALVAWVGGPRFGVSIGIGGGAAVGWFALGPREVFVPSYGYSGAYMERVNITNTVIVNRTVFNNVAVANVNYVNRGVAGAVIAVPQGAMVGGRPVAAVAVRVDARGMEGAQIMAHAAVVPQREAVLGGRAPSGFAPPPGIANRAVITRNPPPPAAVGFEHQQAALAANPGRPLDRSAMAQVRSSAPPPAQRTNYRPVSPALSAAPRPAMQSSPAAAPRGESNARPAVTPNTPRPATTESRPAEHATPAAHSTAPQQETKQQQKERQQKQRQKEKEDREKKQ